MKKNWMQALSLVLNVVLLVLLVQQTGQLNELREAVETDQSRMSEELRTLRNRVAALSSELQESAELIENYTLEPTEIDAANHALEADAVLKLKSWSGGSTVALTVTAGSDTNVTVLPVDGTGTCRGQLVIPVEEQNEICIEAAVTNDGVTTREELGSWGDIAMVVPVQMYTWGGSVPVYQNGTLTIEQYEGDLEMLDGSPLKVFNTCYRLYVNDKLAKEAAECWDWEQPCQAGDTVVLPPACEDEFGLGYEFNLYKGEITETGTIDELPFDESENYPRLTWD